MPPTRMTANPVRPARYRAGKPLVEEESFSEESDGEEAEDESHEANNEETSSYRKSTSKTSPHSTSTGAGSTHRKPGGRGESEHERRQREQEERLETDRLAREAGFVTESEESSGDEESNNQKLHVEEQPQMSKQRLPVAANSSDESTSEEEDSGSNSPASESSNGKPRMLRPVFVKKNERKVVVPDGNREAEQQMVQKEQRRQEQAKVHIQERLEKDAAARAAGKKDWDDDEESDAEECDDTDDLDPELEHQQWVARELTRLKRARAQIEEREAEIAEIERRRNLTEAERDAEDQAYLNQQKEEQAGRGKIEYMQKYFHKGAFYQDEATAQGLSERDIMGARFVDQSGKDTIPEYLQVRDVTRIGRKGRTKYKDMRNEDTGRWGDFLNRRGNHISGVKDDRFHSNADRERTGANASAIGEKRRDGDVSHMNESSKRARIS